MNRLPLPLRVAVAFTLLAALAAGCREGQKANPLKRATGVEGAAGARENPADPLKPLTVRTERAP